MAGELGGRIHLSSPVRRLRWDGEGINAWTDSGELAARAAVIAIPTAPLADIDFVNDIPPEGSNGTGNPTALRSADGRFGGFLLPSSSGFLYKWEAAA